MDYINSHITEIFLIVGLLLLIIEIAVLGFSTFILFFVGLAAVISAILMYFSIFDETLNDAIISTALLTLVLAAALWKKLKEFQQDTEPKRAQSDLIGVEFTLENDVTPEGKNEHHYSGIAWQLKAPRNLAKGTKVKVTQVDVGVMHIDVA